MKKRYFFLKILFILVAILFAAWFALFCGIFIRSFSDNAKKADAIVVLGAAQWDSAPSPMFQARLDHAHDLYVQGYAPVIVLTGGIGAGQTLSEADVGARYLRDKSVSSDALLIDPRGNTTFKSLSSDSRFIS